MNKSGLRTVIVIFLSMMGMLIILTNCNGSSLPGSSSYLMETRGASAEPVPSSLVSVLPMPIPTFSPFLRKFVSASPAANTPIYGLPFISGRRYLVTQAYLDAYSHERTNALDFDLKIGDEIHAAREGLVVNVIQDYPDNPVDKRGLSEAKIENRDKVNLLKIRHDDQTIAWYFHLQQKGGLVKIGEKVKAGDLIAYSGNSGFSSGPHLHFVVTDQSTIIPGKTQETDNSIPVYFRVCGPGNHEIIMEGTKIQSESMIQAPPCL